MIRINLLPVRTSKKQEAVRREALLALAGGAVALFAGLALWGVTQLQLSGVQADNLALQNEIDKLSTDAKRVDEMEKFEKDLQRKLDVIGDLRAKKAGPVHMLDDMSTAAPDRLTLTRLTEKGDNLEIEGIAVSNTVISEYLRALDASPYFEAVFLIDISALPPDKTISVTLKKFTLKARLTPVKAIPAAAPSAPSDPATPAEVAPTPAPAAPADPAAPAVAPAPAGGGA